VSFAKPNLSPTLAHGTISCPQTGPFPLPGSNHAESAVGAERASTDRVRYGGPVLCQNCKTALVMGEARGAALATIAEAGWKSMNSPREK